MNINDLKTALPFLMKARIPALLIGQHGVGKTDGIRSFCKEQGYHLVIKNLSTEEVGDLKGLGEFERDKAGNAIATKFALPEWAVRVISYCENNPEKYAIIFLDEFNRARRDVLQTIFPLLTENRLNERVLPANCYVLAAMNPDIDGYIVTDVNDNALMDRFCHIRINSSYEDWLRWGEANSVNKKVLGFIRNHPNMLRAVMGEFDLSYVKPSDRSTTWMARLQDQVDNGELSEKFFSEFAQGIVGLEASTAYLSHLASTEKPVAGIDVLKNYDIVRPHILAQLDEKVFRTDLINDTKEQLLTYIKENIKEIEEEKHYDNLVAFWTDLPNELAVDFLERISIHSEIVSKIVYDKRMEKKFAPIVVSLEAGKKGKKQKQQKANKEETNE